MIGIVGVGTNVSYKSRWQSPLLPAPTILASGPGKFGDCGWVAIGEYDPKENKVHGETEKPKYSVPTMAEIKNIPWNGHNVVSTFSGAGGSCLGYRMAGYKVLYANEFVEAAQETYRANHPDSYLDCRDIRTVDAKDILTITGLSEGEISLFDGSPPCFARGTLILTKRGLIPIETVKDGDMVITHKLRWKKVTGVTSREAEIVNVRGQGHPGISTTKEHPFYVRQMSSDKWDNNARSYVRTFSEPEWRGIGDCMPNGLKGNKHKAYFWGMPKTFPEDAIPNINKSDARALDFELTPELFWIVGLWLGDGWLRTGKAHIGTSSRGEILICANKKEAWMVRSRLDAIHGLNYSEAEMRTTIRFTICHKGLAEWLEEDFGRGSKGKTVPSWAFGMPQEFREELYDGYLFADGTVYGGGAQRTTSVSWSLILGMAMIARTLGLATSLRCQTRANNNIIENREVNVSGSVYSLDCHDKPRSFLVEEDYCWGRIKEINQGVKGTVYNLHVEEDESYLADGLIVHNCSAFSTSGKRERGWGKIKSYSDGKEQVVDDLFFEYVRLLRGLKPKVFVAENVSGLLKGAAKGYFLRILKALKECGYNVQVKLCNAEWLGVPQTRLRAIFVGVRDDIQLDPVHPKPLPYRYSLRDAIEELEWYRAGGYFDRWKSADEPYGTVPADGHRLLYTAYMSANGYVMDKKGDKRKLTISEVKRICSFPDDFVLTGTEAQQWERMGRSVPPTMMSYIGAAIRDNILNRIPK